MHHKGRTWELTASLHQQDGCAIVFFKSLSNICRYWEMISRTIWSISFLSLRFFGYFLAWEKLLSRRVRPSTRNIIPKVAQAYHHCWFTRDYIVSFEVSTFNRNNTQLNTHNAVLNLLIIVWTSFTQFRWISVDFNPQYINEVRHRK